MSDPKSKVDSLGDIWQQYFTEKTSPTVKQPRQPQTQPRDASFRHPSLGSSESFRTAAAVRSTLEEAPYVTIVSVIVARDWETMVPGTSRHIDEIQLSPDGYLTSSDITRAIQDSHGIQAGILARFYHSEWAAWGRLPSLVKPAVKDTGELWLEVRVQIEEVVQESKLLVSDAKSSVSESVGAGPAGDESQNSDPDNMAVAGAEDAYDSFMMNTSDNDNFNVVLPDASREDNMETDTHEEIPVEPSEAPETLDFFGEDSNGSVDHPWLIVERNYDVAIPPMHGETERTVLGKASLLQTYKVLFPIAMQWFGTQETHPKSSRIYGAEGDVLITPDKLLDISGLEAYFDSENYVERFLLFLAVKRSAFTSKGYSRLTGRLTGKWRPKLEDWSSIQGLPGLLFLDHKWTDDPGQDWNENWNCYLHIVIPEYEREKEESPCLAVFRFVQTPWKPPKFIRPHQRIVQTDIIRSQPTKPPKPIERPQAKQELAVNANAEVEYEMETVSIRDGEEEKLEFREEDKETIYTASVIGGDGADNKSVYSASLAGTESERDAYPPITNFPDIEVPMLPDGTVDWDHPASKATLRNILTLLGEIEVILNVGGGDNLPSVLLSVDRIHPFIRFLREHRNHMTCEGMLIRAQNLLVLGLQMVHREFINRLESSSQLPEADFSLREDLSKQLEAMQRGGPDAPKTLKIPEMPDRSSVRVLNALVSRLVVPEWRPKNGISFKDRRGEALVRNLRRLGVQEIRQDQVNQMRWEVLGEKMKLWMDHINIAVRILFAAERQLCDEVLLNLDPLADRCFAAVAGDSLRWLIGCGYILAASRRAPEKLISLLDMYAVVLDLLPIVEEFFKGRSGESYVRGFRDLVEGLGNIIKDTAKAFEQTILNEGAQIDAEQKAKGKRVDRKGGAVSLAEQTSRVKVQPLTSYVVNYLRLLSSPSKSYLNVLETIYSRDGRMQDESHGGGGVAGFFTRIMRALDHNLLAKAKTQPDIYMEEVFLLNNMSYIVQNITNCEAGNFLGSEWENRHNTEVKKRKDHFVTLMLLKLDQQVFSLPRADAKTTTTRLKLFNVEFENLIQNKSFELISDLDVKLYICKELYRRVGDGYRKFLESHKDFIGTQRSVSKYFSLTYEEVEKKMKNSFLKSA